MSDDQVPFNADRMTTQQAADYLGISKESLKTDRCRGQLGISFYRVGRLARYRKSDLDRYLENNKVRLALA